ncbi:molybdate ABC transporter substrate-binding protein [Caballeronia arationis]|jgi:molybdate transport system substrate-binding protein|uniref:ABC-type molybdate transport system, substrate-binding protein n=1 Tax=Caballeronia arationis TaxID=1777142 RepID=A0A7Z7N2J2_9BURK|nr:substrate-binding domain-containing protein [Caballeronia arationis]SAL04931.1 molybdate ABC transporter substrate-binding protein [Caballeronia arationis]SOE62129.1 ABC-type molybdate transport system, substrate-binding protein [Caballeronia arationis]
MSKQISGISSMATRQVLADLVDEYERRSGQRVVVESVGGVAALARVQDGEPFDIVVLAADAIARLAAAGRVDTNSCVDLARSGVAVAVAAGAARPEIGSEAAVRDAILAARSIGYSTGPSGAHLTRLFERWGIAGTIAPRIVQAPPGVPVGALIARGEVELGFQQTSELMHLSGIEVIGPLPPEIQATTVFSAGVCTASLLPDAARALIAFLASDSADLAKLARGMEPV